MRRRPSKLRGESPAAARVVALGCMHAAGGAGAGVVPLPCAGHLDQTDLLFPFAQGAEGVLLLSCSPGECRHQRCEEEPCSASGAALVSEVRRHLTTAGLSPKRLAQRSVRRGAEVEPMVKAFASGLSALGPWVRRSPAEPELDSEPLADDRAARLYAAILAARGERGAVKGRGPLAEGGEALWLGCGQLRAAASGDDADGEAALALWRRAGREGAVLRGLCCGEPLLSAGEVEAFTALARDNAARLAASGVRRVVTACSHCTTVLGEAYAAVGVKLDAEVIDLFQWAGGRLSPKPGPGAVALVAMPGERSSMGQVSAAVAFLAAEAVIHLDGPPPGLTGPALAEAVTALIEEAARRGAVALVHQSPHAARRWRLLRGPGSWRWSASGQALPIFDLPQALVSRFEIPERPGAGPGRLP